MSVIVNIAVCFTESLLVGAFLNRICLLVEFVFLSISFIKMDEVLELMGLGRVNLVVREGRKLCIRSMN